MAVAKKSSAQTIQRTLLAGARSAGSVGSVGSVGSAGTMAAALRAGALMSGHGLEAAPYFAFRELVGLERVGLDGDAVTRARRRQVAGIAHDARIDEVLVEVVDVLAHAVFETAAHRDVVEDRDVLHILAEADAAGMRADRHAELRRHEQHGQNFVHPSHAAAVDLQEADRLRLEELLEEDAVLADLSGGDADGGDGAGDGGMAEGVVGTSPLLEPVRIELLQLPHLVDRFADVPALDC